MSRRIKLTTGTNFGDILFNQTKFSNIWISDHYFDNGDYKKDRCIVILFLYKNKIEEEKIINHSKKIYEVLKYFGSQKLGYFTNAPKFEGNNTILFKYDFRYKSGITPALAILELEDYFYGNNF